MISTPDAGAKDVDRGNGHSAEQTKFNNPSVAVQSWYVAARSRDLKRNSVKSYDLLNRRIAIYRDGSGVVYALDARCPHLGADLGQGKVVGDQLQCAFHHWRLGPDGRCRHAPGLNYVPERKVRCYPTRERWGLIWIFNGPTPLFDLPEAPAGERLWPLRLPPVYVNCHPHLVLANGFDVSHFGTLHNLELLGTSLTVGDPYRVKLEVRARLRSRVMQYLTGSLHRDIIASFTTIGASLTWLTVMEPIYFYALFTGRPSSSGGCHSQTMLFLPAKSILRVLQIGILVIALLYDDQRVLDNLAFFPGFTENDAVLKTFAEKVNSMETW
jgi:phenylpropionate dioxygenase-like ring-hydroxylating dioxygenase large terminal subunit